MTDDRTPVLAGGCQCGAVRYALYATPERTGICHCRMCQRAVGGPFFAATDVALEDFAWTRGAPKTYRSSSIAERTFCGVCGTPLSFRYLAEPRISITITSLDDPAAVTPAEQYAIESRLPWLDAALRAKGVRVADDPPPGGLDALVSHQSPEGAAR
jgi:hypothetical protein